MRLIAPYYIAGLLFLFPAGMTAQTAGFSYQIILESKNQYNDLNDKLFEGQSDRMGTEEFATQTDLYPVLKFEYTSGDLVNTLHTEGYFVNYNFRDDSLRFTFQELFTRFSFKDKHFWVLGKKRLDWGTGTIWNPTNFYTRKDPFRTQNRLEGIFQIGYTCLFGAGSLQLYLFPESRLKDFSFALKYNYSGERIDASLSFLEYTAYQQFGYDFSYGGDRFVAYSEGVARNYSLSYKPAADGSLTAPRNRKSQFRTEAVAGMSLLLNHAFTTRMEYRFREDYLNKKETKYLKSFFPAHIELYDPVGVSKHSLFGSVEWKDLYSIWSVQLRLFHDPLSGQLTVSPLAVWQKNNFQVELSSMLYNNTLKVFDVQGSIVVSCHF